MSTRTDLAPHDLRAGTRILLAFCLLEIALFVAAVGGQKATDVRGTAAVVLVAGAGVALAALVALIRAYRRGDAAGRRAFRLGLLINVLGLLLALAGAESLLRAIAVPTRSGLAIGDVVLAPTWDETRARNRALLAGAQGLRDDWLTYVVADDQLGWTIGPDRATPDGLYFSSTEGIRSGGPGIAYAARRPALRIALVGDSHTFSMDGPFEDSWGAQLEARLGPGVQVLNFGVDGYGIDQSWLRYRRDVKALKPDIVLFGFVQHDIQRTVAVYPFLSFGWDYPFAKPRLVVENDRLRIANAPLVMPEALLSAERASDLPFADLDVGYRSADWRWRSGEPPLVARLFGAAFPRWKAVPPAVSDATAMDLSARALQAFRREAWSDGAEARILYFPSDGAGDFGRRVPEERRLARRMLAAHAIAHLDLTPCLLTVPRAERFVPGFTHYTGRANGAVARCVVEDLAARNWLRTGAVAQGVQMSRKRTGAGGGT